MSPFHDLFSSAEFWSALILALLGGGGITADAADKAVKILTESIIDPLREQVAFQETQIRHLEDVQRKYFKIVAYVRGLSHWLQSFCEVTEPEFLKRHPKPSLPDELRPDVAPETIESNKEEQ